MQASPVELLPVEPAPRTARREPADRGFADFLAGNEAAAKPDSARAGAPDTGRQKPPAETATRPETGADETTEGAKGAGAEPTGHDAATPEAAGRAADSEPEAGDPVAATMAAGVPEAPAAAPQAPAVAAPDGPRIPQDADVATAPAAAAPASAGSSAAAAPATEGAAPAAVPGTADAAATASASGEDAAPGTTISAAPAAASRAPVATGDGPAPAVPAGGENAPAPAQPDGSAIPPPMAAAADAASSAASSALRQPAGMRDNTGAAGPAGPASPAASTATAVSGGGDAASGLTQDDADAAFRPPESAPAQAKAQDATGRATLPAQPAANGQASEPTAGATQAAGTPEAMTAGSEPGLRADAPPTGHAAAQGQTASPSSSFANELRLASGASAAPDAAAGRAPAGPVVDQMAVQISRAVSDGQDKLTIDLRPAVLGRVSVSLEVGHDQRVIAVISADRADTLELLQRDARTLERALQDAGLKTDSGSLSFSLNGDGAKKSPFSDGANPEQLVAAQPSDDEADAASPAPNPYARLVNPAGIDIHV